jgi:SPP1 gp7 family putative phage head morphogenesis protein
MANRPQSLVRIRALRDLLAETLDEFDEAKAWKLYWNKAKAYFKEEDLTIKTKKQLFVSFRYARTSAYNLALEALIEYDKSNIVAIRLETRDDSRVRRTHQKWHGVTRPVDDPIWKKVVLPWDFGCRCYKIPIYKGQTYNLTPPDKIPPIPKQFKP